jgi:hypothetical protein
LLDLIKTYIPGFVGHYYGFRQIGDQQNPISFPAVFVEPTSEDLRMITTGKFQLKIVYNIWVFVVDNSPDDALTLITSGMEALGKLLSNNALGDIGSGNSNKFKAYTDSNNTVFWIDSEMTPIEISRSFVDAIPNSQARFMRVGMMRFEILDVVIK